MGDLPTAQFERHGRRHDHVTAVAGDIDMRRLAKGDEIVPGARVFAFLKHFSIPILGGCRTLPDMRRHPVKDRP